MSERLFLRLDGDALHGPEADVPAGTLRSFAVEPVLRRHVAHIMSCRESIAEGHEVLERVVPDGAVRLIFNLGEAPSVGGQDSLRVEAVGAATTPVLVRLRGRIHGLSVTLRPGAAASLLGVPASEIAGTAAPLEALWGGDAAGMLAHIVEQADDAERVAALQQALACRLAAIDLGVSRTAMRAAQLIGAASGQRSLREVAAEIGIGERRLQQLFHGHVGLTPRAWSRLVRLHACLRALRRQPEPRWAELAASCGYYDQSHLVNEFRALCGVTPTQWWSSGSSKTAAG